MSSYNCKYISVDYNLVSHFIIDFYSRRRTEGLRPGDELDRTVGGMNIGPSYGHRYLLISDGLVSVSG